VWPPGPRPGEFSPFVGEPPAPLERSEDVEAQLAVVASLEQKGQTCHTVVAAVQPASSPSSEDGYKPGENAGYGGFTYGGKEGHDLSNTQFALESLAESGVSGSDELWRRAVVFISRCQNGKTVDPVLQELKIGSTGDGGYRYKPDASRGPAESLDTGPRVFSSYGSMTYAALKSLLYANVSKQDPRVVDAFA
jgi:squalene-hopene/tetraprenyl-beta-curcumene cyclase